VKAPTLLIVGGRDQAVFRFNEEAYRQLACPRELAVIPGATHLFPEPGALEQAARLALGWFTRYLAPPPEAVRAFRDREDAAHQLTERLRGRALHDPLVLAIPRGGVVLGAALAEALGADLDVVLARKLRAPSQPELAIGAVSEAGEVCLDHQAAALVGAGTDYLAEERRYQLGEIARRSQLVRQALPAAPVRGRSVIVTDDGIATGATMLAPLQAVRAQAPLEVIVAAPVASPDRLRELAPWCDAIVCPLQPDDFRSIGQFYDDFRPVEEARMLEILGRFAPAGAAGARLPAKTTPRPGD
jgi:predicted phosphoribosyltransferase